ncbi:VOC family protein [Nocardia camponoti]|uniref:VOC family protein n=1 Tax=Nocardia camponoti TaxID=1616106 RepID=A0A917QDT5_9NOCA|nr:VOC family protein [Nocardia camponoti]GGK45686.1 VOC family protein [Nocardia camponoti]
MSINTFFWYDSDAEAAAELYARVLPNSRIVDITRQGDGSAFIVTLDLDGQAVTLMNGGPDHPLTDAASLQVIVDDQAEVDRLWDELTANGGKPGPCGWLTDPYGLSWQIVPKRLPELLNGDNPAKTIAVGTKLRTMSKLDIDALEAAYNEAG